jgi:zinc transport system substrate-binding protein
MRSLIWATLMSGVIATPAFADLNVMVSIKPLHSLVSGVMQGAGQPGLIVNGADSPHTYQLKPSDAAALQEAKVIFWVGHELEAFLEKPLEALGGNARKISLLDVEGIKTMPVREGNGYDAHVDHAEGEHDHGEETDAHIWLDPMNAKIMVAAIAKTLASEDAPNAELYQSNAAKLLIELDKLNADLKEKTKGLKTKSFITFHDAYQYFEQRYNLTSTGAISIHPENPPGAEGIAALRERIESGKVTCVFAEPQFGSKLIAVVTEGSNVKKAIVDPLGANIEPGPELYRTLMSGLSKAMIDCLTSP